MQNAAGKFRWHYRYLITVSPNFAKNMFGFNLTVHSFVSKNAFSSFIWLKSNYLFSIFFTSVLMMTLFKIVKSGLKVPFKRKLYLYLNILDQEICHIGKYVHIIYIPHQYSFCSNWFVKTGFPHSLNNITINLAYQLINYNYTAFTLN